MALNADSTLVVPKDGIVVLRVDHVEGRVSFLIDEVAITFLKTRDGKIVWVSKDNGFIPRHKFVKAIKKAHAILSK